jgi:riboflavin-specific deaminase-like protein
VRSAARACRRLNAINPKRYQSSKSEPVIAGTPASGNDRTLEIAWRSLLAIAGRGENAAHTLASSVSLEPDAKRLLQWSEGRGWQSRSDIDPVLSDFLDLYLPLCQKESGREAVGDSLVVAHLGQSLDGCIATHAGDSQFVTGHENIIHLHRMRALCDAVIVGAGTVASDDPRLTTRLVPGRSSVRVVLDPRRRLRTGHKVFVDGMAPTLLCCAKKQTVPTRLGQAEVLALPTDGGELDLQALLDALARRGLRRLFVEGGGVTVSEFLARGLLNRLQIAVAPLIIGRGRTGVTIPACDALDQALRPACRVYRMGGDMLYDFDLSAAGDGQLRPGIQRVC